ncbi:unnamed protein product [Mytilus coruscus]|uniref:Uncharacterized protein n=1 Tax=Mytilus coruscus TaxID=42192 RepID=A0A6J8B5P8_MYTCO|nr:unnamed protein product [Mytilus coruscus]
MPKGRIQLAERLYQAGVSEQMIMDRACHKSEKAVRTYKRPDDSSVKDNCTTSILIMELVNKYWEISQHSTVDNQKEIKRLGKDPHNDDNHKEIYRLGKLPHKIVNQKNKSIDWGNFPTKMLTKKSVDWENITTKMITKKISVDWGNIPTDIITKISS